MRFILSVFIGLFLSLSVFSQERTTVLISTSFGDMMVELYNETPQHRDNFVKLVKERFYDGTLFHRVIPNFMIQGGDPDSKGAAPNVQLGNGGPGYTIPAELVDGLYHKNKNQILKDKQKEIDCKKFKITLLRISNDEVFGDKQKLTQKLRKSWEEAINRK